MAYSSATSDNKTIISCSGKDGKDDHCIIWDMSKLGDEEAIKSELFDRLDLKLNGTK